MIRYYISDSTTEHGFIELTESEWLTIIGTEETCPYANQVYREEIDILEVPEKLREDVQTIVENKIARWGLYSERNIPDTEALSILTGGDIE